MNDRFDNRLDAGFRLALELVNHLDATTATVVAIPRGGVVVGHAIATKLHLPLDVIVVKKLGAPSNPELAIGAVCADGTQILDQGLIKKMGIADTYLRHEMRRKIKEAKERLDSLRSHVPQNQTYTGKTIILTDDGIATGATIEAAILCIKKHNPKRIILAVPVAPRDTIQRLKELVEETVILKEVDFFNAVGEFYESFEQVDDEEVKTLL